MGKGFGVKLEECLHCHAMVVAMSDDRCPNCWKDLRATPTSRLRRCTLTDSDSIPDLCVLCGEPTTRRRRVDASEQRTVQRDPDKFFFDLIASVFFGPWSIPVSLVAAAFGDPPTGSTSTYIETLSMKLPHCSACKKDSVEVLEGHHHSGTLVITAHERFIEQNQVSRGF